MPKARFGHCVAGIGTYAGPACSIVMSPENMVDAAFAGLDQGERVTIPGLQDGKAWLSFEASRLAISKMFGNAIPGPRYNASRKNAA